jgi:hypothetical protein
MVSHMGNEQTGYVHVFQLDPTAHLLQTCIPVAVLFEQPLVHVQDVVSSALKSVTVHGPVINT